MDLSSMFTTHQVSVRAKGYGQPIILVPFGDVHFDSPLHADALFDAFIREYKARIRNGEQIYFIGMGDYLDFASGSERMALRAFDLHDSTRETLDTLWESLSSRFVRKTEFMAGRLVGLIEGNHFGDMQDGKTSTEHMIDRYASVVPDGGMVPKYMGIASATRMYIECQGARAHIDIAAHHGMGAARTKGGSFNKVEDMARVIHANVYIMGHDHNKGGLPDQKLVLRDDHRNGDVSLGTHDMIYVRSGSFMRGYVPGARSYVTKAFMRPSPIGVVEIEIIPRRHNKTFTLELRSAA